MAGRRWSGEERRQLLAAQEESGLSLWAFARESGIPYTTLAHWKRSVAGGPRLVPVEVVQEAEPRHAVLEVVVGGVVVRVPRDAEEALLARVVRVLRAC
jgi:transposase-like protein